MKVFLHIGTHKTGTTALQLSLDAHRPLLRAHRILYPEASPPPHEGIGHQGLARAIMEPGADANDWDILARELEGAAADDVAVISSEAFSSLKDKHMPVLLERLEGHDVEVIVYLRRQDEYLHGIYCTQVIHYGESEDFESWRVSSGADTQLDYRPLLERWGSAFGRDALRVRPYERGQLAGGEIIEDFAEQIGLALPLDMTLQMSQIVNRSVPRNAISMVRRMRGSEALEQAVPDAAKLLEFVYEGASTASDVLSPRERAAMLELCEESNAEIARDYLGRVDGRLFHDLGTGDEEAWQRRYSGPDADAVATIRDGVARTDRRYGRGDSRLPMHEALNYGHAISPNDHMWLTGPDFYFTVGLSALACIDRSLTAAGCDPASILDMACGHGRVCRMLRAAYPHAEIAACDIDRDGVDFCAQAFNARPVYSKDELTEVDLGGTFDLIWCGSFLTHLDREGWADALEVFAKALNPGGVLVFTSHGRQVVTWMLDGEQTYGLTDEERRDLVQQYDRAGFGYVTGEFQPAGMSLSAMSHVSGLIGEIPSLQLVGYHEAGWANHQDVVSCVGRGTGFRAEWRLPPELARAE